jgi:hypothetical protein
MAASVEDKQEGRGEQVEVTPHACRNEEEDNIDSICIL